MSTRTSPTSSKAPPAGATLLQNPFASQLGTLLQKTAPLFVFLGTAANLLYPYLLKLHALTLALYALLEPYHPEEFMPILFGLVLTFFGGHFFTLFAAIEAYRLCGYEQTKEHLAALYQSYLAVMEANAKDNQVDEDGDGIADVHQISSQELLTRKLSLVAKSVDPNSVSQALSGVWMGFLGVVAVLRTKFAQTVALGATVGQILESYVGERFLRPALEKAIPEGYHKWVPVIVSYSCKLVGVSIAWYIQRVISAFYSSIKGANMAAAGLAVYLARRGGAAGDIAKKIGDGKESRSMVFLVLTSFVAYIGFSWQLGSNFALPFPLNVVLFPLTLAEYFITWFVAVEK